jgi:hypothetical protein
MVAGDIKSTQKRSLRVKLFQAVTISEEVKHYADASPCYIAYLVPLCDMNLC